MGARLSTVSREATGFTLVELLIVVLIIGLGWFALLPNLDLTRKQRPPEQDALSSVLKNARKAATANQTIERITLTLGDDEIAWRNTTAHLETTVARCTLNEETPPGFLRVIRLFPAGHMDAVSMELSSGERLAFGPLDETVRIVEHP